MEGAEFKFQEGSRVRIKDGVDPGFYQGMSVYGNEGVITKLRRDRWGLPEVYIHWDTNHWTYNGAPDRWTYEDHFDLVEGTMAEPSKQEQAKAIAADFAEKLGGLFSDGDETSNKPSHKAPSKHDLVEASQDMDESDYAEAVEAVAEQLKESEAFFVVCITRQAHPKAPEGILMPMAMVHARNPETEVLVQGHAAMLAAKGHQDLAIRTAVSLLTDGD